MSYIPIVDLTERCDLRVNALATSNQLQAHNLSPAELSQRVTAIVSRNFHSGRAQRAMGDLSNSTQIDEYIDRVIGAFLKEYERLDRLATADAAEWRILLKQLALQSKTMLAKISRNSSDVESLDFAQAACEAIFKSPFPYDVSFDAWAGLILKNILWKKYLRSRDLLDRREVVSLDTPLVSDDIDDLSLSESLSDPNSTVFEQTVGEGLLQALQQLSQTQKRIIIEVYLNERTIPETALLLGKNVQAVYNLKHRALSKLHSIVLAQASDF